MENTDSVLADFLTPNEAAAELHFCVRTLERWRKLNAGPPTTKLGRRILYRRSSLLAWIRAHEDAPAAARPMSKGRGRE